MSEITVETGELPVCINCQFKHAVGLLHHVDPSLETQKYGKTIGLINEIGEGLMMTSQEVEDFIAAYQLEHKVEDALTVLRDLRHKIMEGSEKRFEALGDGGNPGNPDGNSSARWIDKWEADREKYKRLNLPISRLKDRIISHKASLILGREFGQDPDAYIERRGLTDYYNWKDYEQWGHGPEGNPDGKCSTYREVLGIECRKAKRIIDKERGYTWPFCDVLNEYFKTCSSGGNPEIPERCEFTKEPVKPKEYFDPDSFRTICPECPEQRCALCPPELACATRIITGCREGEFIKGTCRVGTEAHVIYHTKGVKG